jgi:hypothetical protein
VVRGIKKLSHNRYIEATVKVNVQQQQQQQQQQPRCCCCCCCFVGWLVANPVSKNILFIITITEKNCSQSFVVNLTM